MSHLDDVDFQKWCNQWDAALADGFKGDEGQGKRIIPVNTQTSMDSFFGPQDTHPSDSPVEDDVAYWKDVYQMSKSMGMDVADPEEMLHDSKKAQPVINEGLQDKKSKFPANPRQYDAKGVDQEMTPESLSVTFDEEDIKELADMKLRLYELETKYVAAKMKGESAQKMEQQLSDLKKKFDEFSSMFNRAYPSDYDQADKAGLRGKSVAGSKMIRPHRFGPNLG
jgi:hypothetical protein